MFLKVSGAAIAVPSAFRAGSRHELSYPADIETEYDIAPTKVRVPHSLLDPGGEQVFGCVRQVPLLGKVRRGVQRLPLSEEKRPLKPVTE